LECQQQGEAKGKFHWDILPAIGMPGNCRASLYAARVPMTGEPRYGPCPGSRRSELTCTDFH
jgi:hypothetical protein